MIWYGVLGGKEMVNSTYKNLDKNVHIEVINYELLKYLWVITIIFSLLAFPISWTCPRYSLFFHP